MRGLTKQHSQALEAFDHADWRKAFRLAAEIILNAPCDGEMYYIGGAAALQLHQLPTARSWLQQAVRLSPGRADFRAQYARALVMSDLMPEAIATADAAIASGAGDAATYDTLGVVYSKANAHGPAAEAFQRAVALSPRSANYRFNLATSLMYFGDLAGAEREYEACIANEPSYWRGYLALSQLRRQSIEHNHIDRLLSLLRVSSHPDAQLHLHLALGKEFEDIGEFQAAFEHYARGKAAYGDLMGSSAAADSAVFDAIEESFAESRPTSPGHDSIEPIFVMGMPRTGTTLIDRILSAHSAVQTAGELGHFAVALQRVGNVRARSLAESIANLDPAFDQWADVGRSYIESTRPLTGNAPHFVDKQPHNFLYAGFIARALPKAKLVCVRRNPLDTCLSNFRQLFSPESTYHRYSYDLMDTGRYYLRFHRLMQRWQQLFPGRILEVSYEQLVDSQEATTRELLAFCGLSWDEACLAFEQNEAPVPTASAAQVRSGLGRGAMDRWKRYESQLLPLRRMLEDGGVRVE